jgi:hypothetical protein
MLFRQKRGEGIGILSPDDAGHHLGYVTQIHKPRGKTSNMVSQFASDQNL